MIYNGTTTTAGFSARGHNRTNCEKLFECTKLGCAAQPAQCGVNFDSKARRRAVPGSPNLSIFGEALGWSGRQLFTFIDSPKASPAPKHSLQLAHSSCPLARRVTSISHGRAQQGCAIPVHVRPARALGQTFITTFVSKDLSHCLEDQQSDRIAAYYGVNALPTPSHGVAQA